jgi:hypothetical protein
VSLAMQVVLNALCTANQDNVHWAKNGHPTNKYKIVGQFLANVN